MIVKSSSEKILKAKIIVVTHVYGTGASQDLVRYCTDKKANKVLFIGHPLFYDTNLKGSGYELFMNGNRSSQYYSVHHKIPLFASYFLHVLKTLWWVLWTKDRWDVYVGSNNVNAFTGILLKRLGRVKNVVYYVIDYNPIRYTHPMINSLYHWLDQYCVIHADETWNLSPRMQVARKTYFGFHGGNQKTVPVGIWPEDMSSLSYKQIKPHTIVFLGHILKKQGIQHVLPSIPDVVKRIPDFHFLILGGGEYLPELKKQIEKLNIKKYVTCMGYIKDHKKINSMMAHCALGIALYEKKDNNQLNFTYFADPTKIKSYLAAGLPILISDVPYNASDIEKTKCGKIITSNASDIARTIIDILKSPETLEFYRKNVLQYRKQFNWNTIFERNLRSLL